MLINISPPSALASPAGRWKKGGGKILSTGETKINCRPGGSPGESDRRLGAYAGLRFSLEPLPGFSWRRSYFAPFPGLPTKTLYLYRG